MFCMKNERRPVSPAQSGLTAYFSALFIVTGASKSTSSLSSLRRLFALRFDIVSDDDDRCVPVVRRQNDLDQNISFQRYFLISGKSFLIRRLDADL